MKLELSPDYIPIEKRIKAKPRPQKTTKTRSPLKQRYWQIHGKGNIVKGQHHYNEYYDYLHEDVQFILKALRYGTKSDFAKFIGLDQSMLSNYGREGINKTRTITKLQHMHTIVKGFEKWEEMR